jgi:NAD(P)-dependent dehydrogenase (short-subunit alcohol dehydrogenase family)
MESPFSLKGKVVLVTGASSGIGRQVAISFSGMGAVLVLTGRDESRLQETCHALEGTGHRYVALDLNDAPAVERMLDGLPLLNGVVHAAGILKVAPLKIVGDDDLVKIMDTNFTAPFRLVRLLLNNKKIDRGSSVIFISSINGIYSNTKGFGAYASSKAALNSLMKTLALEYAGRQIRFNAVNPGMVKTEMYLDLLRTVPEKDILEDKKKYPLGDYGEPQDVANACIFLASDASKWMTGASLILDGGFTIS